MIDNQKLFFLARKPIMAMLLVSLLGGAGCSSVPDAVNPVEWYRGAAGWFESGEDQAQRDQAKTAAETAPPLPGANRDYPNLSTVPERPRSVSSPEERNRVAGGLAADRENARYAEPVSSRPTGVTLDAPTAAPRTPVATDPSGPSSETLEALPLDSVPVTPVPRSSRDEAAPETRVAAAPEMVELPVVPPAPIAVPPAPIEASPVPIAPQLPLASESTARPTAGPVASGTSLIEQTYNAAIAQQAQSAAAVTEFGRESGVMPGATAGAMPATTTGNLAKTMAGTPVPGSYVVHFRGGSAELGSPDRALLRDVAQLYKSTNGRLRIVGHTSSSTYDRDALNQRIVNLRISLQRAEAVAVELARLGVPRANMSVAGVSDNEPLYQETTQAGIAGNRRVEIFFGS